VEGAALHLTRGVEGKALHAILQLYRE